MISVKSSDGETFEVEDAVANKSETIKKMIEDNGADNAITLPHVTSRILVKVIEYCKRHVDASSRPAGDGELKAFDAEFVNVDPSTLLALSAAANYLNIKSMLDLITQAIADTIKGMTPKEIRNTFDFGDSFKALEEEEIRRENLWREI